MNVFFRYCPHCASPIELKDLKSGEPKRHVCTSCQKIHFQGPKLAAGILLVHDGLLVLARRSIEPGLGLWSYPGGFVEQGEVVVEAAKREAWEEIHARVKIEGLLGVYSYKNSVIAIVMYRGRSIGEKPKVGDEVEEVGFFSPEKIPWGELAFPSVKDSIKDYLAWTS